MTRVLTEQQFAEAQARAARYRLARNGPTAERVPTVPPVVAEVNAGDRPVYALVSMCRDAGLPVPVPEYQFHPQRKWRFDFAWPLHLYALEIDGGVWTQGRHTRGSGWIKDAEKFNAAALLGWKVLRYSPQQLEQAIADIRIMAARA